jgi:hypothetical protein
MAIPRNPKNNPEDEKEDPVTAAYESLSKKLESLRRGEKIEDDDDKDEENLRPKKEEPEEDEVEDLPVVEEVEEETPRKAAAPAPKMPPKIEEDPLDREDIKEESDEAEEVSFEEEAEASASDPDEEPETVRHEKEEPEESPRIKLSADELKQARNVELGEGEEAPEPKSTSSAFKSENYQENMPPKETVEPQETFRQDPGQPRATFQSNIPDSPDSLDDLATDESEGEDRPRQTIDRREAPVDPEMDIPNLRSSKSGLGAEYSPYSEGRAGAQSEDPEVQPKRPMYGAGGNTGYTPQDDANPNNYFNKHNSDRPAKRANKWHLLILVLIGLGVIGATVYVLKYQFKDSAKPSPTPESSPISTVAEPSPSPTPAIDRSKFKVRVLNGTTKAGLAGTVSTKLKDLGYQTDKTGNAPTQDVAKTQIKAKASASGLTDALIHDLAPDYKASSASAALKENDSADAEVVIGAE